MSDREYIPDTGQSSFPTQSGSENNTDRRKWQRERSSENEEKTALQKAYEVFELEEGAEISEVIKKYKKLSLTYHPDSRSSIASKLTPEEKTAKFQEISEAYKTFTHHFLSEEQKNKEKDDIIEELRDIAAQSGISNYYCIAALEKLQSQVIQGWIERIIVLTLTCLFFYFRRNKGEKENSKKMLGLAKYIISYVIWWPLVLLVLMWDIVAYFIGKKNSKKES